MRRVVGDERLRLVRKPGGELRERVGEQEQAAAEDDHARAPGTRQLEGPADVHGVGVGVERERLRRRAARDASR